MMIQEGIIYTSWWKGRTLSRLIKPTGANWLQVIVTWYQATASATSIRPKTDTSTHEPSGTGPNGQAALIFSLHHSDIDTSPYYCLAFQIKISTNKQPPLIAYFHDISDEPLLKGINIFGPRYIAGNAFVTGQWLAIRIPLIELGVASTSIRRFNLKNNSEVRQDTFLLGELKLMGAILV